jgi:hypothetical protein
MPDAQLQSRQLRPEDAAATSDEEIAGLVRATLGQAA